MLEWLGILFFVGTLAYIVWDVWLKKPKSAPISRNRPDYIGSYDANKAEQRKRGNDEWEDEEEVESSYTRLFNQTLPDTHKWRQLGGTFDLAGVYYRKAEAAGYLQKAIRADGAGTSHGLTLEREPDNPHDPNAIAAYGWVGDSTKKTMIGYIPASISALVARKTDMPIACKLHGVKTDGEHIDVIVLLMLPGKRDQFWQGRDDCPF